MQNDSIKTLYNRSKYKKGLAGNFNSGRKSKKAEQEIIERLSVLDDLFFEKLTEALQKSEPYALKLYATHRLPKPSAEIEVQNIIEQPLFEISFKDTSITEQEYLNSRNNTTTLNE